MTSNHQEVNQFLVQVFNEILKTEELCISNSKFTNLSLREIHIIETVCLANDKGEDNSSMAIAQALQITPGTLTTAVSLLERKGYLRREKDINDKRVVRITATDIGLAAQECHIAFHKEMVDNILSCLDEEEAEVFVRGLSNIASFFREKYMHTSRVQK